MDKQFDELSKSLAEGVSRRESLRKFGIGLSGVIDASCFMCDLSLLEYAEFQQSDRKRSKRPPRRASNVILKRSGAIELNLVGTLGEPAWPLG